MRTIAFFLFVFAQYLSVGQAFLCDNSFYIVAQDNNISFLEAISLDEDGNIATTHQIPLSEPNRQYTCLGMSVQDMHLYALDFNSKELLRINANGEVINLGVPENLDANLEYWAGDVSPEGKRLVVIGKDKAANKDTHIYSISLVRNDHYAGSINVVSTLPTAITDVATDPIRGIMYAYDKRQKQIVVIGTNVVTHHQHESISVFIEGLFFDKKGNLYAYGGNETSQSVLYAVDKISGQIQAVGSSKSGRFSDGCSCPYSLEFYRTIAPEILLPCQEFTITYTILNKAGEGKSGVYLEDILPEEFLITELVEHTFTLATVESGVGSNRFAIPNLDILIGKNTITLKAKINPTDQHQFETQATLQGLPIGLQGELDSDNPATEALFDSNINYGAQSENLQLDDHIIFDCDELKATLNLPIRADRYLWSDGSTKATLVVRDTGWYWVQAESECLLTEDSIYIDSFQERLNLDLGTDQKLKQGAYISLDFVTNATTIKALQWSSQADFDLSCMDCNTPFLNVLRDNTYYLRLTDEAGCVAIDSLQIKVEKIDNLYIPNAFSPNDDGDNDRFFIQGIEGLVQVNKLQIFDRWGSLVYYIEDTPINDYATAWNGRWKGKLMPSGTYLWVARLEFIDERKLVLNGTLVLMAN